MRPVGGVPDFSGHPDVVEEIQHDQDGVRIGILPETPDRLDFDADQYDLL
ncbi:MAG TPA: hypothetical protein VG224_20265 [Reyranella sp.]|jgi:hypothetical protein|nr:hypothetical protein [Reyranella sp.]